MSELPQTPSEDPNFEGLAFKLNYAERTQLDLFDTQDGYLERLTKFVNFPYDSVLRRRLVGRGNDMYELLLDRVDQIAHIASDYDVDPIPPASKLIKQLDAKQIQYFNTHHRALIPALPLSTDQIKRQFDKMSFLEGMDLPQSVIHTYASRTHQNIGHYLLGRSVSEWNGFKEPPSA